MQIVGYNWDSLNRHGTTPEMIDEVLAGSMVSSFQLDEADHASEMIVGFTFSNRLLEIGVRYFSEEEVFIFHAQSASPQYKKLFLEDWKIG